MHVYFSCDRVESGHVDLSCDRVESGRDTTGLVTGWSLGARLLDLLALNHNRAH